MTNPVQTSEYGTQTTPSKLKPAIESDIEAFTDEETEVPTIGKKEGGKRIKAEAKKPKKGKKKLTKKELEAGVLPEESGEDSSKEEEIAKGRKKRKKKAAPAEDTEIDEDEPTTSKKPKKKTVRKRDTDETVGSDFESEVKKKPPRKRETKKKKKEEKKAAKKKAKKEVPFRKGKFNPKITLLTLEKERESTDSTPFTSCCVECSNRNPIRAVLTNNLGLLKNCIDSRSHMSTLFDSWSPEITRNAFYYAVVTNNLKIIHALLEANKNARYYCRRPNYLIRYLDTGMVSQQAFGVRVRKVQMARGNRQGNNAFLEKYYKCNIYDTEDLRAMLEHPQLEYTTLEKLLVLEPSLEITLNESIVYAVASGNRKIAAYLINRIKGLTNHGFNNLHFEVLALDGEDLKEFHKQSVHKKATGNDQVTPTHCACINPNPKYLEALFAADLNVNLADLFNRKPIHYAAACESSGPLELLFTHGASPADLDNYKRSPLHYAAMHGRAHNVRILIDKAPMMLKARDKGSMMPFHHACMRGHLEAVKAFIEKGANPNLGSGPARLTPLGFAAAYNHYNVCEYLVNNKGRVLSKDKFKRTPLAMAARNGNAKLVSFLLQKGSLWDEPDSSGNTPLHYAAAYGWIECAEELIKAGANVNANSSWKITPLNIAMLKNHFGLVKYLLNQPGIDVNCKDEQGRTLISLAVELTTEEALDYMTYLLRDKKADPNVADINGRTPLHYLVTKKVVVNVYSPEEGRNLTTEEIREQTRQLTELRRNMIVLLLKYNANINIVDKEGRTLFDKCLESTNYDLLELFTGIASFSTQPMLLFSFAKLIYNPKLKRTFDYLLKNSVMNSEIMNSMDNDGFTPFLRYLKTFVGMAQNTYQKIYLYVEFQLKKLKYEGAQEFSREKLNIQYDNYMENVQNSNDEIFYAIRNYQLYYSDREFIKEHTLAEFKASFIDVIVQVLQEFVALGANPALKVGKLKSAREPTAASQYLNNASSEEEEEENYAYTLPAKLQRFLPNNKGANNDQFSNNVTEYCHDGLKCAWHFVAQKPLKELVTLLEGMAIPMDEGDWVGTTPFMDFIGSSNYQPFMGYNEMFGFFKAHGVNMDKADLLGVTPFLMMVGSKRFDRAAQLIEEGANVNVNDIDGNFALKYTVNSNDVSNTKMLLERFKADPNKTDKNQRTCLHIAINNSSPTIDSTSEMENLLLDCGADVNAIDRRGRTPLHYAFVKIGRWEDSSVIDPIEAVTTLCSKLEINVNIQDKWGKTPLHYAAQRNSTISSIFLLNRGATLETKDRYGNTPLGVAFLYGHPDYAITLIERNANVSALVYPENPELFKDQEQETDDEEEGDERMPRKKIRKVKKGWGKNPYQREMKKTKMNFRNPAPGFGFGNNPTQYGNAKMPQTSQGRTVTDTPKSMFRIAIRMGWQGLLYLLLDKNYDYMLGMEDALSEGKYQLLLNLLKKTAQDSVVQRFNDKKQNLMHILALHGGNASYQKLQEIYLQFVKRGVKHMAVDVFGRSALHYAIKARNQRMINILLNASYDPNLLDIEGFTPLTLLIKGNGIESSTDIIKELLLAGSNLNVSYAEDYYDNEIIENEKPKIDYYTTPFVHLVRYTLFRPWSHTLKNTIVTFLEKGADPSIADSEGRDAFMYCALENSEETLNHLFKHTARFNPKAVDKYGKTAMHYAVKQYDIGSYQNTELLNALLAHQFDYSIPDQKGLTPVDYAAGQTNGRMLNVFKMNGIDIKTKDTVKWIANIKKLADWPIEIDFAKDAEEYMKTVEELLEKETEKSKAKVDSVGNHNEPLEVVYDDKGEPYDCYMNKVNIKNGTYGEYLFYRMQLIRNTNRDVYMVYTRWGRIGETGMFQKTPFGTKEEAAVEFGKIFKSKSGNEWSQRHEFKKIKKRYVLMAMKTNNLHYKQLIKPFDYKHLQHKSTLPKPIKKLLKSIVDVAAYERAMSHYGINCEELPITRLKKETLLECKDILEKLGDLVTKLDKEREKGLEAKVEALEEMYDQINEISSQYYELLPQAAYREFKPPPLVSKQQLNSQHVIIEDLINIESASKLLLGAQSKLAEMNPLDYCYKALSIDLQDVPMNSEEYELINQYIRRSTLDNSGYYGGMGRANIEKIFRVQRRGENERFESYLNMSNRWLLYHGSKTSNFLGILSQGLRIAPPNVAVTGWAFGKGIYFADMFSKSAGYCYTFGGNEGTLLMLICEVALGKMSNAYRATFDATGAPAGYDSVKAEGSRGPNMKKRLYLEDGSEIPIGEIVEKKDRQGSYAVAANEYIVFNPDQVRLRYLVQWKNGN